MKVSNTRFLPTVVPITMGSVTDSVHLLGRSTVELPDGFLVDPKWAQQNPHIQFTLPTQATDHDK